MTVAVQKLTFEEYLRYEDGTDTRYELVNGELIPMSLGTARHGLIIRNLTKRFQDEIDRQEQAWISIHSLVGVRSPRGKRLDTSRIPDITILPLEQMEAMQEREAVIDLDESPPLFVVEVVSPSTKKEDYQDKRAEYGFLEIPEYWIVDPLSAQITVFTLDGRLYNLIEFRGEQKIQSSTFPDLDLTVAQILSSKL